MKAEVERFLRSQDHCRLATLGSDGFPHCVPVGYHYYRGLLYVPTYARSRKARNLNRERKCCVIVDEYRKRIGRGVMLQGTARVCKRSEFPRLKRLLESLTGWRLDNWRVGQTTDHKVDTILVFKPQKVSIIGRV